MRLVVAGAGIDAPVDPVGVTRDGLMQLPDDVHRVGWYRFGPAPGQPEGTAVLAGHVDAWDQGLGALGRLRGVAPGQAVEVDDSAGAVTRWQVVTRQLVVKEALPLAELFARAGPPRLVLLTCGGPVRRRGCAATATTSWSSRSRCGERGRRPHARLRGGLSA